MLRSFWITCVLLVASATAWAQPTRSTEIVERAQASVKASEQKLAQLTNQRLQLSRRHGEQLNTVDRLKKQKASWRRDRELNKAQADANDTAARLTAIDIQIKNTETERTKQRNAVLIAIDIEIASGTATDARKKQLQQLRAQLAPAPAPKKIVIPNADINPLSDPEELERQASAIAAIEKQLEAQKVGLDQHHKDLTRIAELRGAHDRASELSTRDDDQPHRGAPRSSGGRGATETSADGASAPNDSPSPGTGGGSGAGGGDTQTGGETFGGDKHGGPSSTFESTVANTLGEAIDKGTIEKLMSSRNRDPKARAEAAKQARDAVQKQIDLLKNKRRDIEKRAKQLRTH